MSNKTQLQTNNTALDSLITRVNTAKDVAASLPEAGSSGGSGGGNIETCTINFSIDADSTVYNVTYSCLEEGKVSVSYNSNLNMSNTTLVLENVICGSFLYIDWSGISPNAEYDKMILLDYMWRFWQSPKINGHIENITLLGDD